MAAANCSVVAELQPSERKAILASEEFTDFFSRATRVIERALEVPWDVTVDYSQADRSSLSAKGSIPVQMLRLLDWGLVARQDDNGRRRPGVDSLRSLQIL